MSEFRVLGETDDLLAVDKPPGLLVHPSKPGGPRTLWDDLRAFLGYELANGGQVSLINRLDRETSGIVLVAKTSSAARKAAIAMQEGRVQKRYLAITCGWPAQEDFLIDAPIIRLGEVAESSIHLQRAVHPAGAPSQTRVSVLTRYEGPGGPFALVEARPLTGRTHQIRVHLSHTGTPVLGDKIYGPSPENYLEFTRTGWTADLAARLHFPRHALHSCALALDWDSTRLEWTSPLPDDMAGFLSALQVVSTR